MKQWKQLESIVGKISQKEDNGLLIGANFAKSPKPIDIIPSKNERPYAFKTKFDWCIVGPVNGSSRRGKCCNWIDERQADTNEVGKHFFQAKATLKETDVKEMLTRLYNQKFM